MKMKMKNCHFRPKKSWGSYTVLIQVLIQVLIHLNKCVSISYDRCIRSIRSVFYATRMRKGEKGVKKACFINIYAEMALHPYTSYTFLRKSCHHCILAYKDMYKELFLTKIKKS